MLVYFDTVCRRTHFSSLRKHVCSLRVRKQLEIPSTPTPQPPPLGDGSEGLFLEAGAYIIPVRVPSLGPGPHVPAQALSVPCEAGKAPVTYPHGSRQAGLSRSAVSRSRPRKTIHSLTARFRGGTLSCPGCVSHSQMSLLQYRPECAPSDGCRLCFWPGCHSSRLHVPQSPQHTFCRWLLKRKTERPHQFAV